MTPNPTDVDLTDVDLARAVAHDVGQLLLNIRKGDLEGHELMDAGDKAGHERAVELLQQARPHDVIFSEEGQDPAARLTADRCWIVDPLDGTRSYGRTGEPGQDWAVHIALWEKHNTTPSKLSASAVSAPALGHIWATDNPPTAPTTPTSSSPTRIVRSRTRGPAWLQTVADQLQAECLPRGSAGVKFMAVVTGQADAYIHAGGQWEWDSAAPAAIALAGGWHASRLDGSPLTYNQEDPHLPDLIVCHPHHADELLETIAPFHTPGTTE